MIIKGLRKTPKYMLEQIKKQDLKECPEQNGKVRFYSYLAKYKTELVLYTVAVKNRYSKWHCKQVVVHGLHSKRCYLKDICFSSMAGYRVGWFEEGFTQYPRWYENRGWGWNDDKYFYLDATIVNPEFLTTFEQYKYSQAEKLNSKDIFKYLRLYEQYPIAEMLMKLGLDRYATSVSILRQLTKDKQFRKWLYANKDTIPSYCYVPAIIKAYKTKQKVQFTYDCMKLDKDYRSEYSGSVIKQIMNKDETQKLFDYIIKQDTSLSSYEDYIRACRDLGLDLTEEKHRYPHNFQYWHDMRIDQLHTKQAEEDRAKRKALYDSFSKVANKYLSLERLMVKDDYVCLIAKSPEQLVYEGEQLDHCVGRMNYDQKFAREETLIFFIRNRLSPNTPLVTLEYSLTTHKVLQCYAEHDTKPAEPILNFVNNVWLPYANKKIKAIA